MSKVLVTGGAGFIGSTVARRLEETGHEVIVADNLSTGSRDNLPGGIPLEVINAGAIDRGFLARHGVDVIMHFAARIRVEEAEEKPAEYFACNVGETAKLIEATGAAGIGKFIFSSSAAVYGERGDTDAGVDLHQLRPDGIYGLTKLMTEKMLRAASRPGSSFRTSVGVLRYFNVAGTNTISGPRGPVTHLMRACARRHFAGKPVSVFGTDYDTRDGTAIRDYIHVLDLADAHIEMMRRLEGPMDYKVMNAGSGSGYSVAEVVNRFNEIGFALKSEATPRRPGDVATLVARLDANPFSWAASRALDQMIHDTITWEKHLVEREQQAVNEPV